MIYTKDDKLLLKISELSELFKCTYTYIRPILCRYNFTKYWNEKPHYILFNEDFIQELKTFMSMRQSKRARKIVSILEQITPLSVTAEKRFVI